MKCRIVSIHTAGAHVVLDTTSSQGRTLGGNALRLAEEAQGLVRKIEEAEQRVQTTVRAESAMSSQEVPARTVRRRRRQP